MHQTARRRHLVPAFGEWNYYYGDEAPPPPPPPAAAVAAEWYLYAYGAAEAEACSDVWFKYSTPPRRPTPTKARRPEGRVAPERAPYVGGGKGRLQQQAGRAARAYKVADAGVPMARTPARGGGSCRVVRRAVDADLYQVPPPEFVSHRPRRLNIIHQHDSIFGLHSSMFGQHSSNNSISTSPTHEASINFDLNVALKEDDEEDNIPLEEQE
ncbi:hypothetical protein ABZP36_033990 [Zizania latifolia]